MRIGLLTGGGDVPGLNPCIKAIVAGAAQRGWDTIGFLRGWAGPLSVNPDDEQSIETHVVPLDLDRVRGIERAGGTMLRTSRTNPAKVAAKDLPHFLSAKKASVAGKPIDCTDHVLRVLERLKIDTLIALGGDDTLSYASRLASEGFRVLACPKTMDNDVYGTDFCMGFGTAVSRSVEFIDALRTPAASHERIAIVELFGRHSGETALISGYLGGADRVLISEVPVDVDKLADLVMADKSSNPENYVMIAVSEGARLTDGEIVESGETDAYGHRKLGGIGQVLGEALKQRTGEGIINQTLAYLMRAGTPAALDRMVASAYGSMAVQCLETGQTGLMMAVNDGKYCTVPIGTCMEGERRVDVDEFYDVDAYRPDIREVHGKPMFLY